LPLFNPDLLETHESSTLLDIFLPSNIFSALAHGNFLAIVIFSSAIGIVLFAIAPPESNIRRSAADHFRPLPARQPSASGF